MKSNPRILLSLPLPAVALLVCLVLAVVCPVAIATPARADLPAALAPAEASSWDQGPRAVPEWRNLTPEEETLWLSQDVDRGSPRLVDLAARRESGETTTIRLVVILVEFPDRLADQEAHPPAYYEELLFSRGVHPTGSVADYFAASSHGRLELTGEVYGWYRAPQAKSYYTASRGGIGYYPTNSQKLAEDAILLANPELNYARYDNEGPDLIPDSGDDDEVVDGVVIVHAGSGHESGNQNLDFISIKWRTNTPVPVDGVFGDDFTLNPEDGNIGIYAHELGHLFGLPDLYPRLPSIQGASFGLGAWSLMSGGLNLQLGVYPADLDAWSKVQLGFVDVVRLFTNRDMEVIAPTQYSGRVYRLWRDGGAGSEYFLLENRIKAGIDRALPGGGLLIYHVDDKTPSNNNPDRYHVALEQADGRFQLEDRYDDGNVGDAGDPFTEGTRFGLHTVPDSRSYGGDDTYVSVFGITGPDPVGNMTANLRVEANALVDVVDVNVVELEGNGDGFINAGEIAGLVPTVAVSRLPAEDLTLSVTSLDPLGEVLDSQVVLGTVLAGQEAAPPPLRIRVGENIPEDPYGIRLAVRVDWKHDMGRSLDVEFGVGTRVGRTDDFETLDHGWTHERVRPTSVDQWIYGPTMGTGGTSGFKCGYLVKGFLAGVDAVLTSPPILLPPDAALVWDQLVDVVFADTTQVRAGGVVEISLNGGDWQIAIPEGGYPARYVGNLDEWNAQPVFAKQQLGGKFHTRRIDLSGFRGSVRVRFHFFSEVASVLGQGWHIDNVRVESTITPVRLVTRSAEVAGEDVRLTWRLADPLPADVRWLRGADAASAQPVGAGWMPAEETGVLVDEGAAALLPATYWLEGRERDGRVERWGPWPVSAPVPTARLQVLANPSRDASVLEWSGGGATGPVVDIMDVRGRRVLERALDPSTERFAWDGRGDDGTRVAPGIYFARVRGVDAAPVRLVRLP